MSVFSFNVPAPFQALQQIVNQISGGLTNSFQKGQDVNLARGERLILHSSTGAPWIVAVSTTGTLTVTGQPGQWKFNEARNSGLGLVTGML